ncbi:rhomboid family intramembrane serine protease [Acetatifactor aquisgranensis]|uniref:rhomboid family intramembrane serine protease n=1 Tax=Acetatifactor aquisgranensis TaxID=2941233 RepID=UPI00203CDC39|nr:rhomboid family intramembrane serine protease [Acetatifactor aquisgranensis]MCI8543772.1 rhomboid family intramembrane serine protease [Lachnospiraceae bacterium]
MRPLKFQPIVSAALVAVNVLVFLMCHFAGNLIYGAGELDVYHVLVQGEYGRILWSMFLHSGINHLFNNMVILFFLGAMIEKEVGHIGYGVLYFLSGIGGNVLSLLSRAVQGDMTASLGASGAVFGLDGVLLAMVLFSGRRMENVTPARVLLMITYSLYSGFRGQNIDNVAHVGGLLTGFAAAGIMCFWKRWRQQRAAD